MRSLFVLYFVSLFIGLIVSGCAAGADYGGGPGNQNANPPKSPNPNEWHTSSDASSGSWSDAGMSAGADAGVAVPPNEKDKFEHVGTNPYVMVASDPQSTFAVDVDTASYDLFVRDMGEGYLPVPASVRLEEYVNYFPYDFPAPSWDDDLPFKITLDGADNPFVEGTTLLSVGIKGREIPPEAKRDTNLVFVVDISGSMGWDDDKLPLVKEVVKKTLKILYPTDLISIVTYSTDIQVALPPTPVANKSEIISVVDSLTSYGSTAGHDALSLAYDQAESAFIEGGFNHLILCTDGDFNIGPASDADMLALITEKRKTGITMTVLGFGTGNLNDSMMEKITNAGNGVYAFISSLEQAHDYVMNRMLSNILLIAKDMKIQVEFNPAKVLAFRLLGYENRAIADELFRDDTVDAGEIGSGHTVTALYELVMVGDELPLTEGAPEPEDGPAFDGTLEVGSDELLRVKVRWKELEDGEEDPASEVQEAFTEDRIHAGCEESTSEMQWAVAIAAFAEIVKESPYASLDNLAKIQALVDANVGQDPIRLEFQALLNQATSLLQTP